CAEIDRSAANAVQALDHRRDFGRSHVGAEDRHLLAPCAPLADQALGVLQGGDETDPVEQRAVLGPVLDLANILEEDGTMAVPWARRGDEHAVVADRNSLNADTAIVAEAAIIDA